MIHTSGSDLTLFNLELVNFSFKSKRLGARDDSNLLWSFFHAALASPSLKSFVLDPFTIWNAILPVSVSAVIDRSKSMNASLFNFRVAFAFALGAPASMLLNSSSEGTTTFPVRISLYPFTSPRARNFSLQIGQSLLFPEKGITLMVPSPATVSDIFNDSNHKLKTNSRTTKQIEPTGRLTQTPNSQLSILTNSRGIALSLRSVLDTSDYR